VHRRRTQVLSRHFAEMIPPSSSVLDVGCGDGLIAALVRRERPELQISGADIAVRPATHIPVTEFDGLSLPFEDHAFDTVMIVDVIHHSDAPEKLLGEVARVAKRAVVIKDVTPLGPGSDATLRFMDWVGNARHDVPLPYRFWSQAEWRTALENARLAVEEQRRRLDLYPLPFSLLFEKRMHFILRLRPLRA
jgi:SAM-dependent methyltransferase